MDTPCSSGSSPPDLTISTTKKCPVCYKPPHGIHFGAYTCRACAVFFRRFGASNNLKPCKKNNVCDFYKNGYVSCKKCRLKKCFEIGMKIESKGSGSLLVLVFFRLSIRKGPIQEKFNMHQSSWKNSTDA